MLKGFRRAILAVLVILLCLSPFCGTAASATAPAADSATAAEKARAAAQYTAYINDLSSFPISLTIGSANDHGFGKDFTKISQTTAVNGNSRTTTTRLRHTSGLLFELKSVYYPDYAAFEWTLCITNDGKSDSPVIRNLMSVNINLKGTNPYIRTSNGNANQWLPIEKPLNGSEFFRPNGGRSTDGASSYFNFEYGDQGILFAVGWPGEWIATFDNSADASVTNLTAGQDFFDSYLKPGETVRTTTSSFVLYDGRDADRATNLWRRWFIDCAMHRVVNSSGQKTLFASAVFGATSAEYSEMTLATEKNQIFSLSNYLKNGVKLDYWWMDAGWYLGGGSKSLVPGGWESTGSWQADPKRFPTLFRSISDYAHKNGTKTLLWFEPERVGLSTDQLKSDGSTINPSWLIGGTVVNLGNKDAEKWVLNRILKVMKDGGISLYREDLNLTPLDAWNQNDKEQGPNRSGITENLYVQAHLRIWDAILAAHPDAEIDSCAAGGNRNDLDTMRRAVALHKTDYAYEDHLAQQAIALEMAQWIPYFGTKATWSGGTDSASKYALRTALVPATVLGYQNDQPVDWGIVRDFMEEHQSISSLIYADYYKLTPYNREYNLWTAWEYFDPRKGNGCALFFRHTLADPRQTIRLKGLDPDKSYHIWFEDRNDPRIVSGKTLMADGITVSLPAGDTSDILYIRDSSQTCTMRPLKTSIIQTSVNGQYGDSILAEDNYYRFDIRLNMSLRNTVLAAGKGTVEYNVQNKYLNNIVINGKMAAQLTAQKPDSCKMDYDVDNNILRVYVAKDSSANLNPKKTNTVIVRKSLATYGGVTPLEDSTYRYSPSSAQWKPAGPFPYRDLLYILVPVCLAAAAVFLILIRKKQRQNKKNDGTRA